MKYILIIFSLAIFVLSCDKKGEPFAAICFSKPSYKLTDTIRVDNCSKKYTKQRWLLPDGTTSYGDYVYYIPTTSGKFTFTLYVSNDEFVNDFEVSKEVTVFP